MIGTLLFLALAIIQVGLVDGAYGDNNSIKGEFSSVIIKDLNTDPRKDGEYYTTDQCINNFSDVGGMTYRSDDGQKIMLRKCEVMNESYPVSSNRCLEGLTLVEGRCLRPDAYHRFVRCPKNLTVNIDTSGSVNCSKQTDNDNIAECHIDPVSQEKVGDCENDNPNPNSNPNKVGVSETPDAPSPSGDCQGYSTPEEKQICQKIATDASVCDDEHKSCLKSQLNKCKELKRSSLCEDAIKSAVDYDNIYSQVANGAAELERLKRESKACEEEKEVTQSCCGDPMSCLLSGGRGGGSGVVGSLGSMLSSAAVASAKNMKESCELSQKLMMGGAAANAAASFICGRKVSSCKNTCGEVKRESEALAASLEPFCKKSKLLAFSDIKEECSAYKSYKNQAYEANKTIAACGREKEKALAYTLASGANILANKVAQDCDQYAEEKPLGNGLIPPPVAAVPEDKFNGDCSNPAFHNDPICVKCRNQPEDPACKNIYGINSPSAGDGSNPFAPSVNASNDRSGAFGSSSFSGDESFGDPGGPLSATEATNAGLAQAGGGGGGGAGLSGGGGGGVAPSGKAGRGRRPGKGYKTDIMNGTRGGGGYTTSSVATRGRSGYSPRGGKKKNSFWDKK